MEMDEWMFEWTQGEQVEEAQEEEKWNDNKVKPIYDQFN